MKRSCGILLWKKKNNEYYVLLTHFGGPYWEKINEGAWSLQKGLIEAKEKVYDAAKRESFEETNLSLPNTINYLASKKISNKKLAIIFESYFDGDISNFKSNTFKVEYPKASGIIKEYPEMDKIAWFSLEDAKRYINKSQLFFINRLETMLKTRNKL